MSALLAERLVVGRGAFRLPPLDLTLEPRQRLALIGPNGAGKSTLLNTFAGLLKPVSGRLQVAAPVAVLPPPGEVEAPFTARRMAALGRAARRGLASDLDRADLAAADAALERLGVAHLAERPFDRLSSGQRQLALIARTLVQDGAVVLADEPTATLDPAHAARVAAALDDLAGEGRAVVVATHDLSLAARQDRVLALTSPPRLGAPSETLTPSTLEALYGAPLALCPTCGRAH